MNISTIFLVCLCLCVTLEMAATSEVTDLLHCTDPVKWSGKYGLSLDSSEMEDLSSVFRMMDKNANCFLDFDELWKSLSDSGVSMDQQDTVTVFKYFDRDGSRGVDIGEYLVAVGVHI
ncbi:calcyphosin-like protein [Solea solea]|uniref:calcyphosin-like protein n=1 Tax=Solea solea TaxID=90069 RepID=UPI00272A9401|nr:calcyphosin-like protein [Solea solea]